MTIAGIAAPPDVGVSVNVEVLTVDPVMVSLNVTTTLVPTAIPVAAFTGFTAITVGGVISEITTAVLKVDEKAVSALFATSFARIHTCAQHAARQNPK